MVLQRATHSPTRNFNAAYRELGPCHPVTGPDGGPTIRTHNIRFGFSSQDSLGSLPPLDLILFAGLWCLADREGRRSQVAARVC